LQRGGANLSIAADHLGGAVPAGWLDRSSPARIMAEKMRPILGQAVIIENQGGAGGSIAVGRVARSAPDGYTIDIGQWDTHVGSIIYNINYDLQKDFEPLGLISSIRSCWSARKICRPTSSTSW
jgi:tripartite-type tricarboxylate transporter receptor subunit TctC